jgi:hypothetical protein
MVSLAECAVKRAGINKHRERHGYQGLFSFDAVESWRKLSPKHWRRFWRSGKRSRDEGWEVISEGLRDLM